VDTAKLGTRQGQTQTILEQLAARRHLDGVELI
jgi:hypothetical protein